MGNLNKLAHIYVIGEDINEEVTIIDAATWVGEEKLFKAITNKKRIIDIDFDYFMEIEYKEEA